MHEHTLQRLREVGEVDGVAWLHDGVRRSLGGRRQASLWVCVHRCIVREGPGMASAQLGMLAVGGRVECLERREVDGHVRLHTALGWASVQSKSGVPFLRCVEDELLSVVAQWHVRPFSRLVLCGANS